MNVDFAHSEDDVSPEWCLREIHGGRVADAPRVGGASRALPDWGERLASPRFARSAKPMMKGPLVGLGRHKQAACIRPGAARAAGERRPRDVEDPELVAAIEATPPILGDRRTTRRSGSPARSPALRSLCERPRLGRRATFRWRRRGT
jgi:hypothetical protein